MEFTDEEIMAILPFTKGDERWLRVRSRNLYLVKTTNGRNQVEIICRDLTDGSERVLCTSPCIPKAGTWIDWYLKTRAG